jgi:predicted oxidoreductase (fatty acid repression mutant protein)
MPQYAVWLALTAYGLAGLQQYYSPPIDGRGQGGLGRVLNLLL